MTRSSKVVQRARRRAAFRTVVGGVVPITVRYSLQAKETRIGGRGEMVEAGRTGRLSVEEPMRRRARKVLERAHLILSPLNWTDDETDRFLADLRGAS